MAHLHIRDVDEGLLREVKTRAVQAGMTLRAYVIMALSTKTPAPVLVSERPKNFGKPDAKGAGVGGELTGESRAPLPKTDPEQVPGVQRGMDAPAQKRKLNLGGPPAGPKRMDYTRTW